MNKYTAVVTTTRREIHSAHPKRMLLHVRTEGKKMYRQHLWVYEELVSNILRTNKHRKRVIIEFTAEQIEYLSADGMKKGLKDIRDIKVRR